MPHDIGQAAIHRRQCPHQVAGFIRAAGFDTAAQIAAGNCAGNLHRRPQRCRNAARDPIRKRRCQQHRRGSQAEHQFHADPILIRCQLAAFRHQPGAELRQIAGLSNILFLWRRYPVQQKSCSLGFLALRQQCQIFRLYCPILGSRRFQLTKHFDAARRIESPPEFGHAGAGFIVNRIDAGMQSRQLFRIVRHQQVAQPDRSGIDRVQHVVGQGHLRLAVIDDQINAVVEGAHAADADSGGDCRNQYQDAKSQRQTGADFPVRNKHTSSIRVKKTVAHNRAASVHSIVHGHG